MHKYTVVIISRANERDKVDACVKAIETAAMGVYDVQIVAVFDNNNEGKLGKLRNQGIMQAENEIIVTLDNDIVVLPDFFNGIEEFSHWEEWDVCSCRLLNPDWTRHWDWKGKIPAENYLNHYMRADDPNQSLTGGLVIARREVYDEILWNEERGFYEEEDVEFSNQLREKFSIKFNPYSTAIHNDPSYHRVFGTTGVIRYDS